MKHNLYVGAGLAALAGVLGVTSVLLERHSVVEAAGVTAPRPAVRLSNVGIVKFLAFPVLERKR